VTIHQIVFDVEKHNTGPPLYNLKSATLKDRIALTADTGQISTESQLESRSKQRFCNQLRYAVTSKDITPKKREKVAALLEQVKKKIRTRLAAEADEYLELLMDEYLRPPKYITKRILDWFVYPAVRLEDQKTNQDTNIKATVKEISRAYYKNPKVNVESITSENLV